MTRQRSEIITFEGQQHRLSNTPLGVYLELIGHPGFIAPDTSLWRGYAGTWEILDDRLYLVALEAYREGEVEKGPEEPLHEIHDGILELEVAQLPHRGPAVQMTLAELSPKFPNRMFAHWYTGELRLHPPSRRDEVFVVPEGIDIGRLTAILITIERGVVTDIHKPTADLSAYRPA